MKRGNKKKKGKKIRENRSIIGSLPNKVFKDYWCKSKRKKKSMDRRLNK